MYNPTTDDFIVINRLPTCHRTIW